MTRRALWAVLVITGAVAAGCGRTPARAPEQPRKQTAKTTASKQQGAQAKPQKPVADTKPKGLLDGLDVKAQLIRLSWQERGQKSMEATAVEMVGNTAQGTASLRKVNARLYSQGKLTATLQAPLVEADEKSKVMTASGGVKITTTDPGSSIKVITAQTVKWYSRENKVVGYGSVKARGPVASIDAAAFTADTRLKTVRILADPAEARAVVGKNP